jgi:hypothetical protein
MTWFSCGWLHIPLRAIRLKVRYNVCYSCTFIRTNTLLMLQVVLAFSRRRTTVIWPRLAKSWLLFVLVGQSLQREWRSWSVQRSDASAAWTCGLWTRWCCTVSTLLHLLSARRTCSTAPNLCLRHLAPGFATLSFASNVNFANSFLLLSFVLKIPLWSGVAPSWSGKCVELEREGKFKIRRTRSDDVTEVVNQAFKTFCNDKGSVKCTL